MRLPVVIVMAGVLALGSIQPSREASGQSAAVVGAIAATTAADHAHQTRQKHMEQECLDRGECVHSCLEIPEHEVFGCTIPARTVCEVVRKDEEKDR